MGQLAVVAINLGDRQLAPVGFEVFPAALEFALPTVALGQRRRRVEQQFAEVFQGWKFRQALTVHFFGGVLGDCGEARIDVLHHAVAVDQQKGVGTLLDRTLEQVQGAGSGSPVVVADDLGELVRQFAGEGDFIRLPGTGGTDLLQAQNANHLAIDTDAGVEHCVDVARAQAFGHLPGARVVHGVMGVDGATGVQGVEVIGEHADVDRLRQQVFLIRAVIGRDRHQHRTFEAPQAGAVDLVNVAGTAGDQLGGFAQGVVAAVALPGKQQDQVLLGAHPVQMQQLLLLGALIELQGDLQARVPGFQIQGRLQRVILVQAVNDQQVAAQQVAIVLFVGFAQFQQIQGAGGRVQGVADQVMRALSQLVLDRIMKLIARFRLHQAGVGRAHQCTQLHGRQAELAFAIGIEKQQRPAGFIKPFETQHAEPRGHRQLRHYLGHHTAGGIGLAFHGGKLASNMLNALGSRPLYCCLRQGCIIATPTDKRDEG
ncbi:hypothetical protein D9M71_198090 [compost metagenome]